jgi:hypothetical protein
MKICIFLLAWTPSSPFLSQIQYRDLPPHRSWDHVYAYLSFYLVPFLSSLPQDGSTPLQEATTYGKRAAVEVLIAAGAKPINNQVINQAATPLLARIFFYHPTHIKMLVLRVSNKDLTPGKLRYLRDFFFPHHDTHRPACCQLSISSFTLNNPCCPTALLDSVRGASRSCGRQPQKVIWLKSSR